MLTDPSYSRQLGMVVSSMLEIRDSPDSIEIEMSEYVHSPEDVAGADSYLTKDPAILENGCEYVVSPEAVAWADSCLTKDPAILENAWDSLRDALLETLEPQPDFSAEKKCNTPEGAKVKIFPYTEESGHTYSPIGTAPSTKEAELDSYCSSMNVNIADFWSKHKIEDVLLPTYNENSKYLGITVPGVDFVFQEYKLEQSTEDISDVWEFDIPHVEDEFDELIKYLNKALAESPLEPAPSVPGDSEEWKCLRDESPNELMSGIADLSLGPNSV